MVVGCDRRACCLLSEFELERTREYISPIFLIGLPGARVRSFAGRGRIVFCIALVYNELDCTITYDYIF